MGQQERDRSAERAHGGITRRDGDIATLGDGAQWWLNGTPWARAETDARIIVTHAPHTRSPVLDHLRSHLHA
jgi:hypothetical protein